MEQSDSKIEKTHKSTASLIDVGLKATSSALTSPTGNEAYQLIDMSERSDTDKLDSHSSSASPNPGRRASNLRKKSMILLNTIKNTTISASKILTFKALSDDSAACKY